MPIKYGEKFRVLAKNLPEFWTFETVDNLVLYVQCVIYKSLPKISKARYVSQKSGKEN